MGISVEAVRPSEYAELYELLWKAFEKDRWDYFKPFYENDPWMRDEYVRVVRENGRILCTVTVFDRTVWLDGRRVRMGGIGNVATDPSARGRGLASLVLEDCKELMRREGFDVSLLFAGPVPLYEKHGWRTLDAGTHFFTDVKAPDGGEGLTVRPLSWEKERFAVREIHAGFVRSVNFAAERNFPYWSGYVRGFKNRNADLFGAFRGRECVACGFAEFDRKERVLWLKEFCWTERQDIPAVIAGLNGSYHPLKWKVSKTGAGNPVLAVLKAAAGRSVTEPEKGFMACNIGADFAMSSPEFCAKILHFPGDDF